MENNENKNILLFIIIGITFLAIVIILFIFILKDNAEYVKVTYIVDGVESSNEYQKGVGLVFPKTPSKDGYVFLTWKYQDKDAYPSLMMPVNEDMTFVAVFGQSKIEDDRCLLNCDTDSDGICDSNCDINGDGTADSNIKENVEYKLTMNLENVELKVSEDIQLALKIVPANDDLVIEWNSSDSKVATVDNNGLVQGIAPGNVIITATLASKETATCNVSVKSNEVLVSSINLNDTNINLKYGESKELSYTIEPSNATNQSVTWSSSNQSVVKVDENGKIEAKSAGTAIVTITSVNGVTANVNIVVKNPTKIKRSYTLNDYTWNNNKYRYWLYTPEGIKEDNYPLVVFLPGNEIVRAYVYNVNKYGFTKFVNEGKDYPFYIVSPYCPHESAYCGYTGTNFINNDVHVFVVDLINNLVKNYNIDPDRIIISGYESGANGAFFMASKYKNMFSGLVALEGIEINNLNKYVSPSDLTYLPIWVIDAKQINPNKLYEIDKPGISINDLPNHYDNTIKYVEELKKVGCDVKFTDIDGIQFVDTEKMFLDQELINWMISQKRKK